MKKIAIIGASYLQEPLISKAKELGIETHVFAWAANDVGEKIADRFYPISIVEKDEILAKCKEIGVNGICSIASDLAMVTVNYVAEKMGLVGNGTVSSAMSTNKHKMRIAFENNGDPSPKSFLLEKGDHIPGDLSYPVIVKPIDRSGSRGVTKVYAAEQLDEAIGRAMEQGFAKAVVVEEYAEGQEYSIECVSYKGVHHMLAITLKYTTGDPHFIETGHLEPAPIDDDLRAVIQETVFHALDSLEIKYGASHSEIKIDKNGNIKIIEIGARMGGDHIGSLLVMHSTGIDFVKAVLQIALGKRPNLEPDGDGKVVGIRFIVGEEDIRAYNSLVAEHPEYIIAKDIPDDIGGKVSDSSSRHGFFAVKSDSYEQVVRYMPIQSGEE